MLKVRHTNDESIEAGIDEAGRGPLWGPLYAAAVIWVPEEEMSEEQLELAPLIKDSKKLSEKRRIVLASRIKDLALDWGIGAVTAAEIDELGMTRANQLAFSRALEKLSVTPSRILIDGCLSVYDGPWGMTEQVVEPEADNKYLPVAAASILAKTEHDEWIRQFCDTQPDVVEKYDLLNNKGYGTQKHRAGILKWGEHTLHRKLFLRKLYSGGSTYDSVLEE
jgi:ribonuclease HII